MFSIEGSGRAFFVKSTEAVVGPFSRYDNAQTAKDRLAKANKRKLRPCITCGGNFLSEGFHNRMCDACRVDPENQGIDI